jgi:hypothetical protein
MTTLLVSDTRDSVRCCHISPRVRLVARLRGLDLDVALAGGASPDSGAALSLRAHTLIGASTRIELSREIRRVLRRANQLRSPFDPTVPICRRKIRDATAAFDELSDRLQGSDPVDSRGVAQVRLLLRTGSGPLYSHPFADDLVPAIHAIIDALEPRLWGECPEN